MADIKNANKIMRQKQIGLNPTKFVSKYDRGNDNKGLTRNAIKKSKNKTDVNILLIFVTILGVLGVVLVILHFKIGLFKKKDDGDNNEQTNVVKTTTEVNSDSFKQNPEVYFVGEDDNKEKYLKTDAVNVCEGLDSKLATYTQLLDASNNGAKWVNYGWITDDRKGKDNAIVAYIPDNKNIKGPHADIPDNDNPDQPVEFEFGVNCFGIKPDMDSDYRKNLSDKNKKEKEEEDRKLKAKQLLLDRVKQSDISPFNEEKWSKEQTDDFYLRDKNCDKTKEQC